MRQVSLLVDEHETSYGSTIRKYKERKKIKEKKALNCLLEVHRCKVAFRSLTSIW